MEWYEQPNWKWREDRDNTALDHGGYCERDNQRQRCYDAENFLKGTPQHQFKSIQAIQTYVDDLLETAWFIKRFGAGWRVTVMDHQRGSRWAWGGYTRNKSGWIKLPEGWARKECIVLHELAHAITPHDTGGRHGRFWSRTFLELVRYRMGLTLFTALRQSMKSHHIKTSPKRPPSVIGKACAAARQHHAYKAKVGPTYPSSYAQLSVHVKAETGVDVALEYDRRDKVMIAWVGGDSRAFWNVLRLNSLTFEDWLKLFREWFTETEIAHV